MHVLPCCIEDSSGCSIVKCCLLCPLFLRCIVVADVQRACTRRGSRLVAAVRNTQPQQLPSLTALSLAIVARLKLTNPCPSHCSYWPHGFAGPEQRANDCTHRSRHHGCCLRLLSALANGITANATLLYQQFRQSLFEHRPHVTYI